MIFPPSSSSLQSWVTAALPEASWKSSSPLHSPHFGVPNVRCLGTAAFTGSVGLEAQVITTAMGRDPKSRSVHRKLWSFQQSQHFGC